MCGGTGTNTEGKALFSPEPTMARPEMAWAEHRLEVWTGFSDMKQAHGAGWQGHTCRGWTNHRVGRDVAFLQVPARKCVAEVAAGAA